MIRKQILYLYLTRNGTCTTQNGIDGRLRKSLYELNIGEILVKLDLSILDELFDMPKINTKIEINNKITEAKLEVKPPDQKLI